MDSVRKERSLGPGSEPSETTSATPEDNLRALAHLDPFVGEPALGNLERKQRRLGWRMEFLSLGVHLLYVHNDLQAIEPSDIKGNDSIPHEERVRKLFFEHKEHSFSGIQILSEHETLLSSGRRISYFGLHGVRAEDHPGSPLGGAGTTIASGG